MSGCRGVEILEEPDVVQVRSAFIEAELFAKFIHLLFRQADAVFFENFLKNGQATQSAG